jgi:hypothetical protein
MFSSGGTLDTLIWRITSSWKTWRRRLSTSRSKAFHTAHVNAQSAHEADQMKTRHFASLVRCTCITMRRNRSASSVRRVLFLKWIRMASTHVPIANLAKRRIIMQITVNVISRPWRDRSHISGRILPFVISRVHSPFNFHRPRWYHAEAVVGVSTGMRNQMSANSVHLVTYSQRTTT